MTYQETLDHLYSLLPVFESQGAHAYKPGLERCEAMDAVLGHPHRSFKTIHVAGTNGKGSTSHLLAAILQCSGLKVGLFTSPHLLDFSERIRVNGEEIDHDFVVRWTTRYEPQLCELQPSFFELATMMAFSYFADCKVDIAIIEVGLGGRLDSTNIIAPVLSVITNISFDHTQFLGDTLPQIAAEKAGIMKPGVPCVIGECTDDRVRFTFEQNAQLHEVAILDFACDRPQIPWVRHNVRLSDGTWVNQYETCEDGTLECPLVGECQPHNANTVITAVHQLRRLGFAISADALARGFREVIRLTHLRGRWETLDSYPDGSPRVMCDTGHNPGCFSYLGPQLQALHHEGHPLHIVFGMVSDKDVSTVLEMLPSGSDTDTPITYYWCNAPTPRALPAASLAEMGAQCGLQGKVYASTTEALEAALSQAPTSGATDPNSAPIVFVGGSNFIVCEALRRF